MDVLICISSKEMSFDHIWSLKIHALTHVNARYVLTVLESPLVIISLRTDGDTRSEAPLK